MRLPRSVSGSDLVKALRVCGYAVTRQTGSHIRATTVQSGQHHITVPNHDPIRIGTLSSLLSDVAEHFGKAKDEVARQLFG